MGEAYAVLALSYGMCTDGRACLSNIDLARETVRLMRPGVPIIAQHEIADFLRGGFDPDYVIRRHRDPTRYLDTDEGIRQAVEWLQEHRPDIREIVVVAQPFIHLTLSRMIVRKHGYRVRKTKIGRIGFDRRSSQWWTRHWFLSVVYTARRVLFNVRGR